MAALNRLVAGEVVGYAYASPHRQRPAAGSDLAMARARAYRALRLLLMGRRQGPTSAAPSRPPSSMQDLDVLFARLAESDFRRRFRLGESDRRYLRERGLPTVLERWLASRDTR